MKTKEVNCKGLNRRKTSNRWKWMAGATAATAAGVTAPQASATTINLLNNFISATGGNHLNADLTGDGHPDLTITGPFFGTRHAISGGTVFFAGVNLNGVRANASYNRYNLTGRVVLGAKSARFFMGGHTRGGLWLWHCPIDGIDTHILPGPPH
jgi:hypothetical protein